MNELKPRPCPICGAELKIYGPEDWEPTFYDPDSGGDPYNAVCDCGFSFSIGICDHAEFIAALNRRTQPANEPLTLDSAATAIRLVCENGGCPPDKDCAENQDCHKCLVDWLSSRQPERSENG